MEVVVFSLRLTGCVRVYQGRNVREVHSRWREELMPKQEGVKELSIFGNSE